MLIEVIDSPGCAKCKAAKKVLIQVIKEFEGIEYLEVNVLKNPERIRELGVMVTPTIAIDGKIAFEKTPRPEELREKIRENMEKEG